MGTSTAEHRDDEASVANGKTESGERAYTGSLCYSSNSLWIFTLFQIKAQKERFYISLEGINKKTSKGNF